MYEKIKSDYVSGKAELYTGDKSTSIGDKDIYYYKGATTNNNVIFAGFCWKIFRTTETGGVKMMYNGVPSSGQCNNTGSASTIGSSAFNDDYHSLAHVGYMYNKVYTLQHKAIDGNYMYGNSFIYSNGVYTLTNTKSASLNVSTAPSLSSSHYTCFNTTGTCTTVSYVYLIVESEQKNFAFYLDLTNGQKIESVIDEMLFDSNVNVKNSTMKTTIDTWYQNNMTGYTDYLEDTVYCNDRSVYKFGGFNPNGGSLTEYFYFKSFSNTNNLICQNKNDRFTISDTNGNGKLIYPVGMATKQELVLSYNLEDSPLNNSEYHWTMSPLLSAGEIAYGYFTDDHGILWFNDVYRPFGARPVISLRDGMEYDYGDGTSANPFLILID